MNYLAIDTSRSSLTVAVGGKNKAVKFLPDCALTHSVVLMGEIENALAEAEIDKKDIDVFACAVRRRCSRSIPPRKRLCRKNTP